MGKNDSRKSKIIDLDGLKDKTIRMKDSNRDKITGRGTSLGPSQRKQPPRLGKSSQNEPPSLFDGLKGIPGLGNTNVVLAILAIILIFIIVVLVATNTPPSGNMTNNTTDTSVSTQYNHFNNSVVSFNYPIGWNVTNDTKTMLEISRDENNTLVVVKEELKDITLAERAHQWRQNIQESGEITSESNLTIDNSTGYNIEFTYRINDTIINARGVAVSKDENVYFVIFIFNQSLLEHKDEMDMVINSFHII